MEFHLFRPLLSYGDAPLFSVFSVPQSSLCADEIPSLLIHVSKREAPLSSLSFLMLVEFILKLFLYSADGMTGIEKKSLRTDDSVRRQYTNKEEKGLTF